MNDFELGWVVGILEGEGCFGILRADSKRPGAIVAVVMTDHDTVQRLQDLTGIGRVHGPYPRGKWRPVSRWQICRREHILDLIALVYPFLSERRQVAANKVYELMRARTPHPAERPAL